MSEIVNSVTYAVQMILGFFSWGIGLAVAARFVFGAPRRSAFAWFMVGFVINVATILLIAMSVSSYLPEWSNTWSENDYRLYRLQTGIIATPVIAIVIGCAYAAYRRMMLNRDSEAGEDDYYSL